MVNNAITSNLKDKFTIDLCNIEQIDIMVSFIMKSGYDEIEDFLNKAINQGIKIRILTSTYMSITDPIALSKLLNILPNGCIKLYNGNAPSFHPKAYFFKSRLGNKHSYILVGSSNLSKPALTNGIEWNYQVNYCADPKAYLNYETQFNALYNDEAYFLTYKEIESYRKSIKGERGTTLNVQLNKYYLEQIANKIDDVPQDKIIPNEPQEEALFELQKTRNDHNDKALIIAATGVGKTFLAAFDSQEFDTVLFLAHREEILDQAYCTFAKVRGTEHLGKYYKNNYDQNKKILFASIQTLSKTEHLKKFTKNQFQYIIVDEFHHATANSYKKILAYFKPNFMLGLTATPFRLDKKDVLQLCNYNVAYEADLFNAINRNWLVPFYYYGIYDNTIEYQKLKYINGKYDVKELSTALSIDLRAELIFKHYQKHKKRGALGFCVDISHAETMAEYFNQHGVVAATIHSANNTEHVLKRNLALEKLKEGKIEIIFAVDMLNEGVDVPELDLLLFLRPTESPTIFLQQLGRGLRKAPGKTHLKVLDFIGNYKKVDLLPLWLSGKNATTIAAKREVVNHLIDQSGIPHGCFIDFDLNVINLWEKVFAAKRKIRQLIDELYFCCKKELNHIPNRVEFFTYLTNQEYENIKKAPKYNPFRDYITYVARNEDPNFLKQLQSSLAFNFIRMLETTNLQTLYKIALLQTFVLSDKLLLTVNRQQIEQSFYLFYQDSNNAHDLMRYKTHDNYQDWQKTDYWEIAKNNPIKYLCKTHSEIFYYDDQSESFSIILDLGLWCNNQEFVQQVKDCLEFRRIEFLDQRLNNLDF